MLMQVLIVQAVHEMPSGQAAPMIAFIAQHLPSLATLPVSSPAQAAFGEVVATCLAAIRVEVVAAPTLASAVADLLTASLKPMLLPMLLQMNTASVSSFPAQQAQQAQQAFAASGVDTASDQLLGCLLRLYHGAVDLHGQCAATQLQIEPLPGQSSGLSTQQPSHGSDTGQPCVPGSQHFVFLTACLLVLRRLAETTTYLLVFVQIFRTCCVCD